MRPPTPLVIPPSLLVTIRTVCNPFYTPRLMYKLLEKLSVLGSEGFNHFLFGKMTKLLIIWSVEH
jgi:hypothetical protein